MDDVLPKLEKIFQTTNEWLRYAETKNAVLFVFSGAGMTATITYLSAATNIPKALEIGMWITTFLLCLTALLCVVSFLPKTDLEHILWLKEKPARRSGNTLSDNDNLYYFFHLQKYNKHELIDALNRLYFEGNINNPSKKEYLDLSDQIVINAQIASMKFYLSKLIVYAMVASVITVPASLIVSIMIYRSI